jgi:hypothetical protein
MLTHARAHLHMQPRLCLAATRLSETDGALYGDFCAADWQPIGSHMAVATTLGYLVLYALDIEGGLLASSERMGGSGTHARSPSLPPSGDEAAELVSTFHRTLVDARIPCPVPGSVGVPARVQLLFQSAIPLGPARIITWCAAAVGESRSC